MKGIIEHIYEHPLALVFHGEKGKWYSVRPMGEDSYWIENQEGEGTECNPDLLFKMIDILFKKIM